MATWKKSGTIHKTILLVGLKLPQLVNTVFIYPVTTVAL